MHKVFLKAHIITVLVILIVEGILVWENWDTIKFKLRPGIPMQEAPPYIPKSCTENEDCGKDTCQMGKETCIELRYICEEGECLYPIKTVEFPYPPYQCMEIECKKEITEEKMTNWKVYYNPQVNLTFKYPGNYDLKEHHFYIRETAEEWGLKIVLGKIGDVDSNNFINFDLFKNIDYIQGTCIDNFQTYSEDPQILTTLRAIAGSKRDNKFAYWSQWCTESDDLKGNEFIIKALKNIKYSCYYCKSGQPLQFENGEYYEPPPDPTWVTGYWHVGIWEELEGKGISFGDLNNDGKEDAALILHARGGGTGHFYELAIVISHNGNPCYLTSEDLGDRVIINSMTIESGVITLDMIVHGLGEGMCCPSLKKIFRYKLFDKQLIKLE